MPILRDTKVHFLKLVDTSASKETEVPVVVDIKTGEQRALFAAQSHRVVIFMNVSEVSDRDFRAVLEGTKGGALLDVRVAPRFDIGGLNRGKIFGLLEKLEIGYVDYCGLSGIRSPDDDRLAASIVASEVRKERAGRRDADNALCVLLDGYQVSEDFVADFMDTFADNHGDWDILVVPQSRANIGAVAAAHRTLVFVSHAAPQDNAFAAWLAARLKLAGYDPWLDLGELRAGEAFWPAIESAIRDRAAVVLALTSRNSVTKEGVLNEVHFAVGLERTQGLDRFVIPINVDGISPIDMPIQLQRRQYVDFSRGWAEGLRRLLHELESRKITLQSAAAVEVSSWFDRSLSLRSRIGTATEQLTSNWLPIARLPRSIFLHAPQGGMSAAALAQSNGDANPLVVNGMWCTFQDIKQEANRTSPELFRLPNTESYPIDEWMSADAVTPPCGPRGVRRGRVVDLLRRSLDRCLERQHLRPFQLSGRRRAWFYEHGLLPNDRVEWVDHTGKLRRKSLVGYSGKKSVYWHLAIEMKPTLWPKPLIIVHMHVLFSANGKVPLGDARKMHALRRRFCKSWWNDHWRDLMLASLFGLSNGSEYLFDAAQINEALLVSRLPVTLSAPFSIAASDAIEEGEDEEVEDLLAEDEDWTADDFDSLRPLDPIE